MSSTSARTRAHSTPHTLPLHKRRRAYSTGLGVYTEHCGLRNVYMSWGGPEYLYMALVLNQTGLPEQALSLIRCVVSVWCGVVSCRADCALLTVRLLRA